MNFAGLILYRNYYFQHKLASVGLTTQSLPLRQTKTSASLYRNGTNNKAKKGVITFRLNL